MQHKLSSFKFLSVNIELLKAGLLHAFMAPEIIKAVTCKDKITDRSSVTGDYEIALALLTGRPTQCSC